MTETPEAAFARFRQGADAAALAVAFDAVAPDLLRVAAFLLPRDELEDAVHDTFVVAMTRSERYDANERLLPWLLGILANEARMRSRRRRLQQRPVPLPPPSAPDPAAVAGEREAGECVAKAMAALDRDDSALLRLHLFDELSCREIGERLQRNAGTVRTQVSRAMSRLRQKLPSGLAGLALFGSLGPDVLAAVRARVLATAAGMPVSGTANSGRSVSVKAAAMAAVLLVGSAAIWLVWPFVTDGSVRRDAAAVPAEQSQTAGAPAAANALPDPGTSGAQRTPVGVPEARWTQRGLVHEEDGKPIPGARVVMRLEEFAPPLATAVSGADGRYELDLSWWRKRPALDRSRFGLLTTISARGHHSSVQFGTFPPEADPAGALDLTYDFELSAYPTLHGRVVDPDGRPVPAKVTVHQGERMLGLAHAEPDGTFNVVIAGEDSGDLRVEAAHWSGCRVEKAAHVDPGTGTDVGTLQLLPGDTLLGTVTLADGTPFAGARLWAGGKEQSRYWHAEPETDGHGRFTVVRPRAAPCRLYVHGSDGEHDSPEQQVPAETRDVRIVVAGTLVVLRWLDPDGKELLPQKARLRVFAPGARDVALAAHGGDPEAAEKSVRVLAVTGPRVLVPAGSHLLLQASARGGLQVNQLVDVPPGGSRHDVTLPFVSVPRAALEVRIRFRDGGVPEAFNCTVSGVGGGMATAEEVGRERGLCRWLAPLGPVQVSVGAYSPQYDNATETFTTTVATGTNVCDAVLTRRGRFALLLRDAAAPDRFVDKDVSATVTVAGVQIGHFVYTEGDYEITSSEPPIGRLAEVTTLLPLGRHEVKALVEGFEPVSAFVDVAETKLGEVTLLLTRKAQPPGK